MSGYPGILGSQLGPSQVLVVQLPVSPYWGVTPSYGLGIACTVAPGSALTYSVQITCDPVPSNSGNWNNHDVLVGQTTSANGAVAFAITGLRLNVTSFSSGSVNLGVAQWP